LILQDGVWPTEVRRGAIREKKFPFKFIKIGKLIRINAADIGLIEQPERQEAEPQIEAAAA